MIDERGAEDFCSPRRAADVPRPDKAFHLDFIFPNQWQNWIREKVRVFVAFAPIDEGHTMLYLRFYQKFMRTPLLRDMVNRLAMPMNAYIAHQDRRIVQTQRPLRSDLRGGEKMIPGDGPIIAYRRRRQELIDSANS